MSGGIRRSAGLSKRRLQRYLEELPSIQRANEDLSIQEQIAQYEEQLQLFDCTKRKVASVVDYLSKMNDEWIEFIQKLTPAQRIDEERIYDEYVEDESSFLNVLECGREAIDVLETQHSTINNILKRLRDSVFVTPIQSSTSSHLVKLPKLDLRQFYGDPLQWPEFWAKFQAAVDNQPIPDIQKLSYLLTCLKGRAYAAIAGYAITSENYQIVLSVLKDRFGDEMAIKRQLYTDLKRLPSMDQSRSIRGTLENLERILRQLENCGENIEYPQMEITIEEKLAKWVLLKLYERKRYESTWSVKRMRELIEEIIKERELVNLAHGNSSKDFDPIKMERQVSVKETSAFTAAGRKTYNSGQKICVRRCIFCGEAHWSDQCRQFCDVDSRLAKVRELRLCFKCLKNGHQSRTCVANRNCFYCGGSHNSALCNKRTKRSTVPSNERNHLRLQSTALLVNGDGQQPEQAVISSTTVVNENENYILKEAATVLLLCAEVDISAPGYEKSVRTTIFFDSGSQRSFITNELARTLRILPRGKEEVLQVSTFANKKAAFWRTKVVTVDIHLSNGTRKRLQLSALPYLTQKLCFAKIRPEEISQWLQPKARVLSVDQEWRQPQVLIGCDYLFDFIDTANTRNLASGFQLVSSTVGYMLAGKGQISRQNQLPQEFVQSVFVGAATSEEEKKKEDIANYWAFETIGLTEEQDDDENAKMQFAASVRRIEGRYSVGWPWKSTEPKLRSNFGLCFERLKKTVEQLRKKGMLDLYKKTLEEQLENGIIEPVGYKEPTGIVHYLPHQAVISPHKNTTKLRIVFDASARKGNSNSLNDVLYRGPVMLPELCGILLRWRMMKIAITCDIEKAFHQIQLNEEDRDSTRFLWIKDLDEEISKENLVIYRFKRVPFGVISSPFLLATTIDKHLKDTNSTLAATVLKNLYVDNVLIPAESKEEAMHIYVETKKIFAKAGMNIREFLSNCLDFNENLPKEDSKEAHNAKVLGLNWNIYDDTIEMKLNLAKPLPSTKRQILQYVASHFDPLGLILPVLLPLKIFLQELWKKEYGWDAVLERQELEKLSNILKVLEEAKFKIRRLVCNQTDKFQLHAFVDASKDAYATAVYLRVNSTMDVQSSLVFAKSRLCPVKGLTIPRLELLAVLIGCRALNFVTKQTQDPIESHLWSDSQCVLQWIESDKPNPERFIENRLLEIRRSPTIFHYVPSDQNPADIATRRISPHDLQNEQLWWHGPAWLTKEKNEWPRWSPIRRTEHQRLKTEELNFQNKEVNFGIQTRVLECKASPTQELFDVNRYGNWHKYLRVITYVLRFIKLTSSNKVVSTTQMSPSGNVTPEEYDIAEKIAIRELQKSVEKNKKEMAKWQLYKDMEGIIRCRGRLQNIEWQDPIYLPKGKRTTKLIIWNEHCKVGHSGASHTLAQLWKQYWIPQGRSTVKRAIKDCVFCKRWLAKPFCLPSMPPYPKSRVNRTRTFQYVGLDYLGPISIRNGNATLKRWVCLFTCLSTRAVHLEVVDDMSADAFLHCLRRFIARRSVPVEIISDNASQFKLVQKTIETYCSEQRIKWKLITEHAPWQGGIYERLVGLVKQSMRKAIGRKLLSERSFTTLTAEVENILNSRPLTHVADDAVEVIRPIDFLHPYAETHLSIIDNETTSGSSGVPVNPKQKLLERWQKTLVTLNKFWELWQCGYLSLLRERTQRHHRRIRGSVKRIPVTNEIVLVDEENLPRGMWKVGKIVKLHWGHGNVIRTASVKMPNGRILTRPINYLSPLEITRELEVSAVADPNIEEEATEADSIYHMRAQMDER